MFRGNEWADQTPTAHIYPLGNLWLFAMKTHKSQRENLNENACAHFLTIDARMRGFSTSTIRFQGQSSLGAHQKRVVDVAERDLFAAAASLPVAARRPRDLRGHGQGQDEKGQRPSGRILCGENAIVSRGKRFQSKSFISSSHVFGISL